MHSIHSLFTGRAHAHALELFLDASGHKTGNCDAPCVPAAWAKMPKPQETCVTGLGRACERQGAGEQEPVVRAPGRKRKAVFRHEWKTVPIQTIPSCMIKFRRTCMMWHGLSWVLQRSCYVQLDRRHSCGERVRARWAPSLGKHAKRTSKARHTVDARWRAQRSQRCVHVRAAA